MKYPNATNLLHHWFFILPFTGNWTYENPLKWPLTIPQCGGKEQSPIALDTKNSVTQENLELEFFNYQKPLSAPVEIINNGYSVEIGLRINEDGTKPFLMVSNFIDSFEVQAIHFHWGSDGNQGSEHTINGERYDLEMHIVHKNSKYSTIEEARDYPDGFVVLGILFQGAPEGDSHRTLNKIYAGLDSISTYNSTAELKGPLTLASFIPDLDQNEYFTYKGSLTTPPCSESVVWFVFTEVLPISYDDLSSFWKLKDKNGKPVLNNFRPIQRRDIPVFRERKKFSFKS